MKKAYEHKKIILSSAITFVILLMLFPLILNYTFFNFKVDSTNGDLTIWAPFFATYYGAIIGLVTGFLL